MAAAEEGENPRPEVIARPKLRSLATAGVLAERLRQQRIGKELSTPLTPDAFDWLDVDLR